MLRRGCAFTVVCFVALFAAYLAFFDARILEIKHVLGAQCELERWTTSWGHLFESLPLPRLDRDFASYRTTPLR